MGDVLQRRLTQRSYMRGADLHCSCTRANPRRHTLSRHSNRCHERGVVDFGLQYFNLPLLYRISTRALQRTLELE